MDVALPTVAEKMLMSWLPRSTICDIYGEGKQPLTYLMFHLCCLRLPCLSQLPGALNHIYQNIYPENSFVIRVECPF